MIDGLVATFVGLAIAFVSGVLANWFSRPGKLRTWHVVMLSASLLCAATAVAVWQDREQSKDGSVSGPSPSPSPTPLPDRTTPSLVPTSVTPSSQGATPTKRRSPVRTPPPDDLRKVQLNGSLTPLSPRNVGRAITLDVTITHATPDGAVAWEFGSLRSSDDPQPCVLDPVTCQERFSQGTAVADGRGVAQFQVVWYPGRAFDLLGEEFDQAGWWVVAVDSSTNDSAHHANRMITIGVMFSTGPDAPPPDQWHR